MNIRKLFSFITVICIAFSIMGRPGPLFAQELQPGPGLNIIEYPLPGSGAGITVAPDGNVWFAEWGSPYIGRMTPDGTVTEFYNGSNSVDIIVGPDGNIWFTGTLYGDPPGGWLGRISPDALAGSEPTRIPDPTGDQFSPHNLTVGSDGNIWYTDAGSDKVVKFELDGSFTEYRTGLDSPHGITSGPDGNLWVAGYGSNSIAKITLDGNVTVYPLPTDGGPFDIVGGPDGNLWYVKYWGTNIGRISPEGVITEFPLSSGYGTSGITVGPDGNLWFTEPWNNQIGRITPDGIMTEYSLPAGSVPGNIATGSDGSIWFTEVGTSKLARIIVNQPPTISSISGPVAPVQLGLNIDATLTFSDPDPGDTHAATWDWGDGSTTTVAATVPGVTTSHIYAAPGVYTITGTIIDRAGLLASDTYQYVVIYDPDGGFVTGGGWVNSPAGAYLANPALTGKVTFGFVAKYQKGANEPTGNTEFQFKMADLNFRSTAYEWLVVAHSKAQYKGTGKINGAGEYKFILTAIDGMPDKFRIKIWNKATDELVYDNQFGTADTTAPSTALAGGSIAIH